MYIHSDSALAEAAALAGSSVFSHTHPKYPGGFYVPAFDLGLRLRPHPQARTLSHPHPPSLEAVPLACPFSGVGSPTCIAEGDQGPLPPGLT